MPTHRRAALVTLASAALVLGVVAGPSALAAPPRAASMDVQVSPVGDDHADGTLRHPVRTLERARDLVRARAGNLSADPARAPQGLTTTRQLYVDGVRAQRARTTG
ncbi:hypothetical protein [Streptomyces sp. NPDC001435]|uniref:hypothetical protein n=1 Tax=unclassified Streptomyces TaxID=2593676 RepID=UPI00369DC17D